MSRHMPENWENLPTEWRYIDAIAPVILSEVEGCVVDLGIGLSTQVLTKHSAEYKRKHYSIDKSEKVCIWAKDPHITHDLHEIRQEKVSDFIEYLDKSEERPALILHDSNHRAKVILHEVSFFIEKLAYGGVIFIHDTCPMSGYFERDLARKGRENDTYKARQVFEKRTDIDVLTWRQGCGLTMILKKDPNEPYYRQ